MSVLKLLQGGIDALNSLIDTSARGAARRAGDADSGEGWARPIQGMFQSSGSISTEEEDGLYEDGWRWGADGYGYYQGGFRMPGPDDD